jgi:transcriptional antiterminator RfaH
MSGLEELNWYAIHTKPRQEERATNNLIAWGVETFTPRLKEKRLNSFTGQPMQIIKPLFPSYIFARFDARTMLHKVWYTRGVHAVLSFGGRPVPVHDEIIEIIRARINEEGFVQIGEEPKVGDKIRINDGLLHDFEGIFEGKVKASKRVMVLLSTVNYQCRIEVESDLIEKVD